MKKIYKNRLFDWLMILINLFVLIQVTYNLLQPFNYLSSYSLRLVFVLVSMCSILSILLKRMDSERFFSIFIIVTLILPPCLILYDFIRDFLLYGIVRTDLIDSPILYLKLLLGLGLVYFSIQFSITSYEKRSIDHSILIILIGLYIISLTSIIYVESRLHSNSYPKPIWVSGLEILLGAMIVLIGYRFKKKKIDTKKGIIYFLILFVVYGLI